MITFREIDDEYLEYERLKNTTELANIEKCVLQEFIRQDLACFDYSKKVGKNITKLAVRKDSIVGKYLLSCQDENRVLNSSKYIDYDKVVNAFNISIFSNNLKMSKSIYPLFINKVEGNYQVLGNNYDFNTIDYILANPSFKTYLEGKRDSLDEVYHVVYEEDKCFLKEFKAKSKTLVKSNTNL